MSFSVLPVSQDHVLILITVQSFLSHHPIVYLFLSALTLEGLFLTILLVNVSNVDISVSAKSWKLLFRHNWISGCCCRFFFVGESMLFHRQSVWKEVVVIVVSWLNGFNFLYLPCSKEIIIITRKSNANMICNNSLSSVVIMVLMLAL